MYSRKVYLFVRSNQSLTGETKVDHTNIYGLGGLWCLTPLSTEQSIKKMVFIYLGLDYDIIYIRDGERKT
jgi:hypothetical protein